MTIKAAIKARKRLNYKEKIGAERQIFYRLCLTYFYECSFLHVRTKSKSRYYCVQLEITLLKFPKEF